MKSRFLVVLLFLLNYGLTAQICTIETVEICAGQEVLIPVTGMALQSIGALTLYIGFDTNNLSFLDLENVNSQLDGMSVNVMSNPTQLAFAWSNTFPISFNNEKLFDLKFSASGSTSLLQFNSGCELSDTDGVVIPAVYVNGSISSILPVIISNPKDTIVIEGGTASFNLFTLNALSYLWRESQDDGVSWMTLDDNEIYSGTTTNNLTISSVPYSFNGFLYQCIVSHSNCQINSDFAKLTVDKFSGINSELSSKENVVSVDPVVFHDNLNIYLTLYRACNVKLRIFNSIGKLIMDMVYPSMDEGTHYINFNASNWSSGNYIIDTQFVFPDNKYDAFLKIIRN